MGKGRMVEVGKTSDREVRKGFWGVQSGEEEDGGKKSTGKNIPGSGVAGAKTWRQERTKHVPGTDLSYEAGSL